jgi:hypothetical protein
LGLSCHPAAINPANLYTSRSTRLINYLSWCVSPQSLHLSWHSGSLLRCHSRQQNLLIPIAIRIDSAHPMSDLIPEISTVLHTDLLHRRLHSILVHYAWTSAR